jgi:cupin fold WbuC family metalloprotein
MNFDRISEEVFYGTGGIIRLDNRDIQFLRAQAALAARGRCRLCAHVDEKDRLHEMLIVHDDSCYVRAHKHMGKSGSYHVIEGRADLVFFDEQGEVRDLIELGEYMSGKMFFVRVNCSIYHTLLIRSPVFVFHETTSGPFSRNDTIFAPWAPEENDVTARALFSMRLQEGLRRLHGATNQRG